MTATDYFEREMDNFIRGYTTATEELQKNTPQEIHRLLHKSYKSVNEAKYLGMIEKRSTLISISTAINEFESKIYPEYPELCL